MARSTKKGKARTAGAEPAAARPQDRRPRRRVRRTQEERRAETRARFIDAAIATICERGYASVTTADITARAGVTWGAAQYLFGSKNELMRQIVEQVSENMVKMLDREGRWPVRFDDRVLAVVNAMWEVCASPTFFALVEIIRGTRCEPDVHPKIVADQTRILARMETLWRRIFADSPAQPKTILATCNVVYLTLIALSGRKHYLYPEIDTSGYIRFIAQGAATMLMGDGSAGGRLAPPSRTSIVKPSSLRPRG